MRSKNPLQLLQYEASRRPEIAEIITRLPNMTDKELSEVRLPLPWYRSALRQLKAELRYLDSLEEILSNPTRHFEFDVVADPVGVVIRWDHENRFVQVDGGGFVEVLHGRILFLSMGGGVWNGSSFSKFIDPCIFDLGTNRGNSCLSAYMRLAADARNSAAPPDVPHTYASNSSISACDALQLSYGVRFR